MTRQDVAELVVRMAVDNQRWGYTRIRGALSNLGHTIARTTVKRILHDHGVDPNARATGTNRPAIVAHAAPGRANVAEHEHAPGPAAGACRKDGCHSAAQRHTRQRGVACRSPSTKRRRRGVRQSSSHRPSRRTYLATARGRPRGIGWSRW